MEPQDHGDGAHGDRGHVLMPQADRVLMQRADRIGAWFALGDEGLPELPLDLEVDGFEVGLGDLRLLDGHGPGLLGDLGPFDQALHVDVIAGPLGPGGVEDSQREEQTEQTGAKFHDSCDVKS